MAGRSRILIVEDDEPIRRGLVDALEFAGFETVEAVDGDAAVRLAHESAPDLVLLDVLLPKQNGFEVLSELQRTRPTLPVIMVTARGAESDRVRGLRDGADDYVVKPFSATELLARVEAVLRRSPERPAEIRSIRTNGLTIDLDRHQIEGVPRDAGALSERDIELLRYLACNHDRAVGRDELLLHVWGLNPRGLETRTVDMQVRRLREKLAAQPGGERMIETVRGKGYRLATSVQVVKR